MTSFSRRFRPLPTAGLALAAVLPNVNRWRGQLGLPPVEEDQLKDFTKTITVGGVTTATRVDCTGVGGQVAKAPPRPKPDKPAPPAAAPSRQIDYTAPPDWK